MENVFAPSIDSKNIEIRTDAAVQTELTRFSLKGSSLLMEGYASISGLDSYREDRIRKTLQFVPKIDIAEFRERNEYEEDLMELTDEEIVQLHIIEVALDNCRYDEIEQADLTNVENRDALGGFKLELDLATLVDSKPLEKGEYHLYLQLEQLANHNDNVKHVKTLPLSSIKNHLNNGIKTTHLEYYSATRVLKYNLIASFDTYKKTLKFENTLLQSFDPREFEEDGIKAENKYIQAIKRRFFKLFYIIFSILPINRNKISFASDSRSDLNGNLYFIYEELYRRDLDLNIQFIFNERIDSRKTFFSLLKTAYHFATSKVILLDDFYPMVYPLKIRSNADLIQVWHAAGAFKTFGFSRVGRPGGPSPRSRNHRNYTKATVSSEGVREHYAEGFGITIDRVCATGVPRSDIFFDEDYKNYVTEKIYERYPFLRKKKVILFAPTFRGNGQASAHFPFETINFKKLYDNLSDEYVFLFKIHPFVKNTFSIPYEYSEFFYDFSDFREINDLLLITDLLITDYSSVCFEFALLNKPMLFFAFDVETYIKERDFYYDYFDFIPGPLVKTTDEIVEVIHKGEYQMDKIKPFVQYFFGNTLGKASRNVVDDVIIPSLQTEYEEEKEEKPVLVPPASRIELFERAFDDEEENPK